MQVTQIEYRALVNTGNYEHKSLSVQVTLEAGESPHEAVARARAFVEAELKPKPTESQWDSAKSILANPDDYTGNQVKHAKEIVALCEASEEISF